MVLFASGLLGNQSNPHTHNDNATIGVMVCFSVDYCFQWGGSQKLDHGPFFGGTGGGGEPPASQ